MIQNFKNVQRFSVSVSFINSICLDSNDWSQIYKSVKSLGLLSVIKSIKSFPMDELFSRLMTVCYLKVASYI